MPVTIKLSNRVVTPESHSHCIMCGDKNEYSLKLNFEKQSDGSISSKFISNRYLQGYKGILHGGIICSLLDSAMTHCVFSHNIEAVTAGISVKFLKSIPCGAVIAIKARIVEKLLGLFKLEATLSIGEVVFASGQASFIALNRV